MGRSKRRNKSKENRISRAKRKKLTKIKVLIAIVIIGALVAVAHLDYFHIEEIQVKDNSMVSSEEVLSITGIKKGESIFDVFSPLVKYKAKKNLYIKDVDIDKDYPNKVTITVNEKKGLMQLAMNDKFIVADNEGIVIEVLPKGKELPLIDNITIESALKGETVSVKEKKKLEKAQKIVKTMEKSDLYFKTVRIKGNNVEAYVFDELKCKGEYENFIHCMKSGNLKAVIYDLYQKDKEKGTIKIAENDYCFFTTKK